MNEWMNMMIFNRWRKNYKKHNIDNQKAENSYETMKAVNKRGQFVDESPVTKGLYF